MGNLKEQMAYQNKAGLSVKVGCLVFDEDRGKIFFCDATGKYCDTESVYGLSNERNYENGTKDLPRPFIIKKEKIIEAGDNLFYIYVDEAEQNILILGAMTSWKLNSFDSMLNIDTTKIESIREKYLSRNNKQRFFSVSEDSKGNVTINILGKKNDEESGTGNLAIKVTGTDENGNVNLSMNGRFAITQTQTEGETETPIAQLFFDNTKDAEKIKIIDKAKNRLEMNKDGIIIETTSIRIGKEQTLKKILVKFINAVTKITQNTPSGPTVSPPLNMAEFTSIKQELDEFMDKQ